MGFPGKNAGVDCHSLPQGIFPTQESNWCLLQLLNWQTDSLSLRHLGSFPFISNKYLWGILWDYERILSAVFSAQSLTRVWLFETPWSGAHQALLSMEFSRLEYWNRLPFTTPGDLPDPGIKLVSLVSPALVGRFFTTALPGKPMNMY